MARIKVEEEKSADLVHVKKVRLTDRIVLAKMELDNTRLIFNVKPSERLLKIEKAQDRLNELMDEYILTRGLD